MVNHPTIYSFAPQLLNAKEQSLSAYQNKVVLIVNTASGCGYTPQLAELQQLRDQFGPDQFEVLGFPSNDFGKQEPLEGTEINTFCEVNYGVQFPIFKKIVVKGKHADPLFKFLGSKQLNGRINSKPRWNFHKYLINKRGEVVDYFYTFTKPNSSKIKHKIQQLLSEK